MISSQSDVASIGGTSAAALVSSEAARKEKTRRVALFGYYGAGNFGNDGSLEAFLHFLRGAPFPVEVECICPNWSEVDKRFGIPTIPIAAAPSPRMAALNKLLLNFPNRLQNLLRAFKAAKTFDAIIVPGTGILDDFAERWQGMPYHLMLWGSAARLAGTPFAFVSIGAGPIRHPVSRRFMVWAAGMSKYRSFRDEASRAFLARHGVDTARDRITPDIAFALPPQDPGLLDVTNEPRDPLPTIGIGVMSYFGWKHRQGDGHAIYESYIAKLTTFASWLLDQGFRLRLIIGDDSDIPAIQELHKRLRENRPAAPEGRILATPAASLSDVISQMAETELVVATRFHNVVCALAAGKPIISLGYAKKNDLLLRAAGLSAFTQSVERLDVEELKRQFSDLYANRERFAQPIRDLARAYRSELEEQNSEILKFISGN